MTKHLMVMTQIAHGLNIIHEYLPYHVYLKECFDIAFIAYNSLKKKLDTILTVLLCLFLWKIFPYHLHTTGVSIPNEFEKFS